MSAIETARAEQSRSSLRDGQVVEPDDGGTPYLIEGGRRRPISSPDALRSLSVDRRRIRAVSASQLAELPLGRAVAPGATAHGVTQGFPPGPFDSGKVFLGSGHYMQTHGTIDMTTGAVAAWTRTWTITALGGYHGACYVIYTDAADFPVSFNKVTHRYGVDGTWIGQSDRTDPWSENIGADAAQRLAQLHVVFTWLPDNLQTVLNKWDLAAKTVGDLLTALASIGKIVSLPAPPKPTGGGASPPK